MPVLDRFRLDGRTALITGGSRNIGAAIGRAFAEAGANLILNARDAGRLEAFAMAVREQFKVEVTPIAADLSQPSARAHLIEEIRQRLGGGAPHLRRGLETARGAAAAGGGVDQHVDTADALADLLDHPRHASQRVERP